MKSTKLYAVAFAALTLFPSTFASAATVGSNPWDNHHGETAPTKTVSTSNGKPCLVTGYRNVPLNPDGTTVNAFCFNNSNETNEKLSPYAAIDASKTQDDLYKVQDTGIWGAGQQVARDTFAYQKLPDNTPVLENSQNMNSQHLVYNRTINKWLTAENVNRKGAGQELIPTLTVDSSNPNQEYVEVVSRDNRALTSEATRRLTMGSRPMSLWYLKHPNPSGDKSLATYDTATGLWTSMFHVMQDAPAQTYSTTATIKMSEDGTVPNVEKWMGAKDESARKKVNYDTAYFTSAPVEGKAQTVDTQSAQLQAVPGDKTTAKDGLTPVYTPNNHVSPYSAGDTITVQPYARDLKYDRDMRYPIGRGQTFRLVNPVEGVTIDAHTGAITATRAAVEKAGGTLNVQIEADWTPVIKYSSGGFMAGIPNFGGLGENNYWLNLASGTSSVVGMANENTQIGIDELRRGKIEHALSVTFPNYQRGASFPAKMADGNIDATKYPEAPHAGQRWRLPANFDTDGYLRSIGLDGDKILRMQIEAAKNYGGIVTDRNLATIAFNFESGWSYAPAAREGKNIYTDETVEGGWLKKMFDQHQGNGAFPWQAVQWMPMNYAELPEGSKGVQDTTVNWATNIAPSDMTVRTFIPDRVHENGYVGHATHTGRDARTLTVNNPFVTPLLRAHFEESPSTILPLTSDNGIVGGEELGINIAPVREGVSSTYHLPVAGTTPTDAGKRWAALEDKSDWGGTTVPETDPKKQIIRQAGREDVYALDPKTNKWFFAKDGKKDGYAYTAIPYTIGGVKEENPLAASDYPRQMIGTTQVVDVLRNDSTNFGNNNGTTLTKVKLYDLQGNEVTEYDDGMAKYKVVDVPGKNRQGIQVTTYQKQGFSPTVSYSAVRSDGVVSAKGAMTLFIGGTTGDAITNAHKAATNGEAATQPVNPDLVVTEKGEPEVATENPEFTGGVNAIEAATNEVPEYTGGANAVEADSNKKGDFTGGVNSAEPAVRENDPEYKGGANGEPAIAEPKGEATAPAPSIAPTDSPKGNTVEPAGTNGSTPNPSEAIAPEQSATGKPEQPEQDKPEEPGKPVEAKTGHDSMPSASPYVGIGFGALLAGAFVGVRRRFARTED